MSAQARRLEAAALARRLEEAGLVGWIATPLQDVQDKARAFCAGDADHALGLGALLPATPEEVLEALARLCGKPPSAEGCLHGRSWVDPAALVSQAQAAAERLRAACERGERVLFGTGHPGGPLELYAILAREMGRRGAKVVTLASDEPFELPGVGWCSVRYVEGVACLHRGGALLHTHSPQPMAQLLEAGPPPDLVVGDHGFAGVGLARGAQAVAVVDTNDPALVTAWARGLPLWPLVCDDNRPPEAYRDLAAVLLPGISR